MEQAIRQVSTLAATWVLDHSHLAGRGEDHGQEPAQHHGASHSSGQYASCYLGGSCIILTWLDGERITDRSLLNTMEQAIRQVLSVR
jgi:hypothetical protein